MLCPSRIYTNSKQDSSLLQYSTVAFTCGAAVVTVLRWLCELRSKLYKDSPAFFRERVVFALHKSKQNRSEQPSTRIAEAVGQLLRGSGAPFTQSLMDQTINLEASSGALVAWLSSPGFHELTQLAAPPAHVKRQGLDVLLSEDVAVAARCMEAFSAVKRWVLAGCIWHSSHVCLCSRVYVIVSGRAWECGWMEAPCWVCCYIIVGQCRKACARTGNSAIQQECCFATVKDVLVRYST